MQTEIIIAGFGGQGVLFGGMLLAQAAVEENLQTTWFPAYGAEMRGGTANSTVVIADGEIGSPVVMRTSVLIAMNEQSLRKFLRRVKPGGLVVINASLVPPAAVAAEMKSAAPGITVVSVPATEIATRDIGNTQTTNVILVGAFLKASGLLKPASAERACAAVLADKPKLIAINTKALSLGYDHTAAH